MTRRKPEESESTPRYGLLSSVVAAVIGLLFAYDLFEAISNAVGVVTQVEAYNVFAAENGLTVASIPWTLLVVTLVLPPVVFAVAWWMGRRHSLGTRVLIFVAGLAVVAAVTLSLTALA